MPVMVTVLLMVVMMVGHFKAGPRMVRQVLVMKGTPRTAGSARGWGGAARRWDGSVDDSDLILSLSC